MKTPLVVCICILDAMVINGVLRLLERRGASLRGIKQGLGERGQGRSRLLPQFVLTPKYGSQ